MSEINKYRQNQVRSSDADIQATRPSPADGPGFTCSFCGEVVETLNKDEEKSKYELKWRLHWKCRKRIEKYADTFGEHPATRSYGHLLDDDDEE